MNYLAHRQRMRYGIIYTPEGLKELMGDIAREVMRSQPPKDCMFKFIADYLESLLDAREKAKLIRSIIDGALEDVYDLIEFEEETKYPKVKSAAVVELMEESFIRFMRKKRCKTFQIKREDVEGCCANMLQDVIKKCDQTAEEVKCSRPAVKAGYKDFVQAYEEAVEGTLDTEALYEKLEVAERLKQEFDLKTQAAVQIQSAFRGYRVRRSFSRPRNRGSSATSPQASGVIDAEKEIAAAKIQLAFRAYRTKRDFEPEHDY